MADTTPSQSHNEVWNDAAEQHFARVTAFLEELERIETDNLERTRKTLDEMTRLTKESLDYSTRLTAEWRKLTMDAAQRSLALMQLGGK
jgi:DNA-binding transcriptional regulator/RsmH inhibitor MraZ